MRVIHRARACCALLLCMAACELHQSCTPLPTPFTRNYSPPVDCLVDYLQTSVRARAIQLPEDVMPTHAARVLRFGPGGVIGELDFFLRRPRSFRAVVLEDGSAWRLTRAAFEDMATLEPGALVLLQGIILKSTCLSMSHAFEALERTNQ